MDRYEYYNNFSVGVLRGIARNVGVTAPTTKTKKQIITEILNIERGLQQPKLTLLGRKPKKNPLQELEIEMPKIDENPLPYLYAQSIKMSLIKIIENIDSIVSILDKVK